MPLTFDFHIVSLPVRDTDRSEKEGIAGLYIETKPHHVNRHRQGDYLLLDLSLLGNLTLSPDKQTQLLQRLSQVYFKSSGTTTGAMRIVAESLNHFLMERNTRANGEESQVVGYLTQMVVHGDKLTLAQSGLIHAYWINSEGVTHIFDPELAGDGLGGNKNASVRFFQSLIQAGDSLILTLQPSVMWNDTFLSSLYGQGPEGIRRKLTQMKADQEEAILIQIQPGTGKAVFVPTKPTPTSPSPEEVSQSERNVVNIPGPIVPEPFNPIQEQPEMIEKGVVEVGNIPSAGLNVEVPDQTAENESAVTPQVTDAAPQLSELGTGQNQNIQATESSTSLPNKPLPIEKPIENPELPFETKSPKDFLGESTPKRSVWLNSIDNLFRIPTPIMAIIAVLVPLIVVAISSAVYLRQGGVGEFEGYYSLAQQSAIYAQAQSNPLTQRTAWIAVLKYLDQAEQYGQSNETQTLRAQAQTAMDQLDFIQRLDFMVALSEGLPADAQVVKMIATENELFMLDTSTGVVWRAEAAARGYVLHPETSCGAGINGLSIGKLIGFSVEKRINEVYSVIRAADANGNVVTCQSNQKPRLEKLTAPDTGKGALTGFLVERGNFYALDPQKNAVWIYWGGKANQKPELFFSQDIPPMKNILDFAVYQDDLYLLYQDGHLVQCAYNSVTPTRCTDPQPYKDSRPGRENQALNPESPFSRVFASQPPDPALYFLEPSTPAIYQFSLRLLAFHVQYRENSLSTFTKLPRGQPASAFAISTDHHLALLAYGNQIYYASLP